MLGAHRINQLVYVSLGTRPFSEGELRALLQGARKRNAARGITGMLLYQDAMFMQALEGAEADVESVYAKIIQDPRHCAHRVLWSGNVAARSFGEWTMGFVHGEATPLAEVDGYRDFFAKGGGRAATWSNPSRATELLRQFRDLPWRELQEIGRRGPA